MYSEEQISTYFEEHDVIPLCDIHIRWVFAFLLHFVFHVFIDLLEIVSAKNNTCRISALTITEIN